MIFIVLLIFISNLGAQTCLNPNSRIEKLKKYASHRDSIYDWVKNDLEFIQFKQKDMVADVGTYDGYYPLVYSVFTDSIDFSLIDIIPDGFEKFNDLYDICSSIKSNNITNYFRLGLDSDTSIGSFSHIYDKVLIRDALHHFKFMDRMLVEVKRIMKPNAKLILFEPIVNLQKKNETLCNGSMTRIELLKLMEKNYFKLIKEKALENDRSWFEFSLK